MKSIKSLYSDCRDFLGKNTAKALLVFIAMVLAYGFYCTTYTLNVDDVFDSFWNGGRLIAAGRFTGYLMQAVTGFMTYSPFFTMFLALCIYFAAGLVMAAVINKSANGGLSANALLVFWAVFVTYPLVSEQFVYPIIVLISLGYLMIAVSIYLINNFFETKSAANIIIASVLIVLSVDFYEAFASVFLTLMMITVLTRYCFSKEEKQPAFRTLLFRIVITTLIMLAAIVIRFALSKLTLLAYYGTAQTGYSGNNQIYWGQIGVVDCAIWLLRTVFLYYFWAGINYLPVFVFAVCVLAGDIIFLVITIKRKSAVPVLGYCLLVAAVLSLSVLLGIAANYTMAQPLAVFVAFIVMTVFILSEKHKALRIIAGVLICLLVLNQAKSLNNRSVTNYERHQYEMAVVDNIGTELEENYDVENKPVVFIGSDKAPRLPEYLSERHKAGQPAVKFIQRVFVKISDKILPERYFKSIGGFYGADINNASDLFEFTDYMQTKTTSTVSYISWAMGGTDSWFRAYEKTDVSDTLYDLFEKRGYELIKCSDELYLKYAGDYTSMEAYPKNGYIADKEDCILVNFGE